MLFVAACGGEATSSVFDRHCSRQIEYRRQCLESEPPQGWTEACPGVRESEVEGSASCVDGYERYVECLETMELCDPEPCSEIFDYSARNPCIQDTVS